MAKNSIEIWPKALSECNRVKAREADFKPRFWLDNVKNLSQYILRYTVGNSLTSLIMSHFVGWHAALCDLQRSSFCSNCRSALEWGWPYSKFSFGEVYCRIYVRKSCFTALVPLRRKTKFPNRISDEIPPQMKFWIWLSPKLSFLNEFFNCWLFLLIGAVWEWRSTFRNSILQ